MGARSSGSRAVAMTSAIVLAQLQLAGDCVDGVTPDCDDAAARCGPDGVDGAPGPEASAVLPEASADGRDTGADVLDAGAGDS